MNVITIILSILSSLLVAFIMFFWWNDNKAANLEPEDWKKERAELVAENKRLKDMQLAHSQAQENRRNGIPATSPYDGSSFQATAKVKSDLKKMEINQAKIEKLNRKIGTRPDTETSTIAEDKMSNSALASITGEQDTTLTEEAIVARESINQSDSYAATRTQQSKRISEIRNATVQAKIAYIKHAPEGDVIYAVLVNPQGQFADETILAVRRNVGIAGNVKIMSQFDDPDQGHVFSIQVANGPKITLKVGDELILPSRFE